ncbi:MAG: DUF262 domain-containing protein [Rhodobacteraceae bacterium]|nr:DUF262 domain-containing protein [Paracoccaceae bacterium]
METDVLLLNDELKDIQNYELEVEDTVTPSDLYSISSYGIDFPVELLVKRINEDHFIVPEFQRKFVWSKNSASRFIESLLLGLPIPNIFLFKEPTSEKHLIIDGQQRLMTLVCFFKGKFNDRKFTLSGISELWEGKTFESLNEDDRLRLCNSWIRTTIFKQDSPKNNMDSVYEVFERLNTGGLKLSSQEIRSCIFHGKFNEFLHDLNENKIWREICGPKSKRLRDIEIILRFFAFLEWESRYTPPMKHFLNLYMEVNRECSHQELNEKAAIFEKTVEHIFLSLGQKSFRINKGFNVALFDSVATSIAKRLKEGTDLSQEETKRVYLDLLENEVFKQGYTTSTANPKNIRRRFGEAKKAFEVL